MYIYFDKNGTIKEVINDESIRRGSSDYNKIYCYLEGNPDIDDIWYLQKNPDGTLTNEVSFIDNIVTKSIPYDSHRDMKYFQDFEEYKFYVFTLSSSYLSQNGLVVATIRVAENNTLWALGELTFNVQANIVNSDNDITQSQYDYLLLTISSYYSKTEIDNKLDLKADKSTTYTKTESDNKFVKLNDDNIINGYNEFYGETKFFNDVYVDNFDIIQTRGSFSTDSNVEASSFSRNGTGLDSIYASKDDTYTKSEVDSKLDLKADKSDTYTKQEVNETAIGIVNYIDEVRATTNTLYDETQVLRSDVDTLQNDVDNLKSVQNVVDVVATYSALQSYDTSKLDVEDKVQVIADETHDGASTIYNWDGSAWQYIGAYGTNSYTKNEVDTKLSTKADKNNTYTKQEVNDKLDGYIKNDDTTYSATVRGKEVVVSTGAGNGSTTYKQSSIHKSNPRKPTCDYYFPDEKSGTLALTSDIPTVNDPTITFLQGTVLKGTIHLNQSENSTIVFEEGGSGGGSSVVANPTLSGDEATLNGLEVDGTKYKVGGGSEVHLYSHNIMILSNFNGDKYICCDILTNDSTPFTTASFLTWLYNNYYRDSTSAYIANGTDNILGIYSPSAKNLEESKGIEYINLGGVSYLTLADIIRQVL